MNGQLPFQNILIVEAGAVGGFFGAHLAKHHKNVSFLLRTKTLESIRAHGLTVRSATGRFTVYPRADSDPQNLPSPDLLILGVKAYDIQEVLRQIRPILREETIVLTMQNGVTIEERILETFPQVSVIGGVAFIYSRIAEPGIIDHYKRGALTIGELSGEETPRLKAICELFQSAGISCSPSRDIRKTKWEKMCWNCVFNPLTVMMNDRVAKALDYPEMLRVISSIVEEVVSIAGTQHIELSNDMPAKVVRWSQELRDIHTSMYDDWKAGRSTEIDYLNGYIVSKGYQLGIPTPVNETLTAFVKVLTGREDTMSNQIHIEGRVVQPLSFDRQSLSVLSEDYQVPDVSLLAKGLRGTGVRMRGLLEMAPLSPDVDHVTFHSQDGKFFACLTLAEAKEYGILLYEMDGEPIPVENGGPFRLVAPGLGDLCANVKAVERIELTKGLGKDTRPSLKTC